MPPPAPLPLCLQTASSSSKIIICNPDSSPFSLYSFSASAKSLRIFSSDCPTYLLSTSGPLITFGSRAFSILPICRAIKVLPVPGGPNNSIPLTCWMPNFSTNPGGKMRDAKARRKIVLNSASSPPIPISSNLKSGAIMEFAAGRLFEGFKGNGALGSLKKLICV